MSPHTSFPRPDRRVFLGAALGGAALVAHGCAAGGGAHGAHEGEGEDVSVGEDLMREHGVLERVLLVYEEAAHRCDAGSPLAVPSLARAAQLVREFVEDYHEKLEEEFLFPRFEAAAREVELVGVLRTQHVRGRALTADITRLASTAPQALDRKQVATMLRAFSRMYRPHAAREDTVLFPAFRALIGAAACRELGEQFEEREHTQFGADGFENAVKLVAEIEREFGVYDLAQFTGA